MSLTTSTLISTPNKDYASAFASLQSSFGFGGTAPFNPSPKMTTKASSKKSTPSKSTPSSSNSTHFAHPPRKDYASAFASLQSSFGFGGTAPNNPSPQISTIISSKKSTPSKSTPSSPNSTHFAHPPRKDYASAFASLQSSFGFGATAPSTPSHQITTKTSRKKSTPLFRLDSIRSSGLRV